MKDALYAALNKGLASRARQGGHEHATARAGSRAHEARGQAEVIRRVLPGEEGKEVASSRARAPRQTELAVYAAPRDERDG